MFFAETTTAQSEWLARKSFSYCNRMDNTDPLHPSLTAIHETNTLQCNNYIDKIILCELTVGKFESAFWFINTAALSGIFVRYEGHFYVYCNLLNLIAVSSFSSCSSLQLLVYWGKLMCIEGWDFSFQIVLLTLYTWLIFLHFDMINTSCCIIIATL